MTTDSSSPVQPLQLPTQDGLNSGSFPPQSPSTPATLRGANPLSSKVTSVLSTSYADTEFREALTLLDERGILNSAETRRQLRLDLQKEVIDSNGEIIDEFGKVAEQLRRIGITIGKLNESHNEMRSKISAAHTATSSRRQVERKQELLKAFKANFVLSEDEVATLTLTSEPVNDAFFAVLSKAKKISKDCEVLLGFENQTLGLEIMELASRNVNLGFQKLYRWIQREFKTLNLENPQIGSSIRRALRVLAERPTLFQNCLDFFAEAREHILSDSFYTALTGSSASSAGDPSVKPIELAAHDPLRYVGDMLAWTHSAAVGEREALEVLFVSEGDEIAKGIQAGRENEVWRLTAEEGEEAAAFNPVTALNELVDRDMSGAVRILRQRVEQVIQTNEETILAYKLANLLNFYKGTFSKLLSPQSSLVDSLGLLESEALRQFRALMRDHIASIQGDMQHTPTDLHPPEFLLDALEQLSAIMKTYETSLTSTGDREADFRPILAEAFDPFISGCTNMAQTLDPPSNSIFLVNCSLAARGVLTPFDFTEKHVSELDSRIDKERAQLADNQYFFLRSTSGLDALIESLGALEEENREDVEKVRLLESVQPPALTRASQILDDFLPSALMDAMENLKDLQDSKMARDITEEAAERFCVDFEHVEEMLMLADEMAEQQTESGSELELQSLRALYLTCSTAVYYESQGNEDEAMRCWKLALDQIYDHNANRTLPSYAPRSETEKALIDSLRQLELQCKERIDLLEALRLSRQENAQQDLPFPPKSQPSMSAESIAAARQEKGWIGDGTIPAITYTQLSRPEFPRRPSLPTRTSSEQAVVGDRGSRFVADTDSSSSASRAPALPPSLPSPDGKSCRTLSPERHTMRTTLRSGRSGDRPPKAVSRRPLPTPADGPGASKAATLAWGALSHRDKTITGESSTLPMSTPNLTSTNSSEQLRRSPGAAQKHWDSHSRRLVTPRVRSPVRPSDDRSKTDTASPRHSGDYFHLRPSALSVSAASSALNSLTIKNTAERLSPELSNIVRLKTAPPGTPRSRLARKETDLDAMVSQDAAESDWGRKNLSDPALGSRKPVSHGLSESKGKATPSKAAKGYDSAETGIRRKTSQNEARLSLSSADDISSDSRRRSARRKRKEQQREASLVADTHLESSESSAEDGNTKTADTWKKRKAQILKNLPPGVDEHAAKQILNEIVVQGDEVHWSDIAGLEIAKNALRETVVYPFLRPDLFMGLREPARGMLLFGPPGTGKTMLARAVATESKSTFFSISASSLTSKYLGESEKLVRALFVLAKCLAPSIIFVDEIDSLLSQRSGSGEHEATRRIKTEFLIQWSDLQRAAAGREVADKDKERGDANRVLVLAATNLPWAIDEAARRRFVRRQYIPLPEAETRVTQIKTLLSQQKHTLDDADIEELVGLTDGFSGSDITALAKDAAMGPLRSLGEALLQMTMDEIRPIELGDFKASLTTIRPSVSKAGLKEYEDWAREFGERGG
ncbi:oligomeric complex COG6-domain-containing protein [Diplogelasinospora grovesii]|uniref:Conserved oligomeric Golgi complex subunit 6 n=1 Tax=Diplogelasinospora grovesii TaxID=303347 RepID=A0AAN6S5H0_9PEZI|nr:oligomeric complex COG6-domain-containing protein [Diplogelasinospora grovesii]